MENPDPNPPRPVSYHNRTGHILLPEHNIIQQQFDKLEAFANEHEMQINMKKTKVMLFNTRKRYDFQPKIINEGGEVLDVEEEMKLLGVKISSDLSWHSNTKLICSKGYTRLWLLRNLKKYGTNMWDLKDVYEKQVRSVLEMAVPAWEPGLTKNEANQIERVQRTACAIILGTNYKSYSKALITLELETLADRRKSLCLTFAKKALKNEKFQDWFIESESGGSTTLKEVEARTKRYRRSPHEWISTV